MEVIKNSGTTQGQLRENDVENAARTLYRGAQFYQAPFENSLEVVLVCCHFLSSEFWDHCSFLSVFYFICQTIFKAKIKLLEFAE